MAGQWGDFKTVVVAATVSTTIDQQSQVYPRLPEAWDALEWLLARTASTIDRAPNNGNPNLRLYVQADDRLGNVPAIWVVYRLGEEVEVLAVNIVPPSEDESDNG